VRLTVTEFLILQCLAQRPGYVKSRDSLMDAAYDDQVYVDDRTIDSHIKRLRKSSSRRTTVSKRSKHCTESATVIVKLNKNSSAGSVARRAAKAGRKE